MPAFPDSSLHFSDRSPETKQRTRKEQSCNDQEREKLRPDHRETSASIENRLRKTDEMAYSASC
jgi:hypothetical protein